MLPDAASSAGLHDLLDAYNATTPASIVDPLLDASARAVPGIPDYERPRYYLPAASYPASGYYPQVPLPVFENAPLVYEKFDMDTLFFVFYFQSGTVMQYACVCV